MEIFTDPRFSAHGYKDTHHVNRALQRGGATKATSVLDRKARAARCIGDSDDKRVAQVGLEQGWAFHRGI